MAYRKTQFTKEELEQQEKDLVRDYIRVKEWLEKNCPTLKHKIDKFNHQLFHFLQDNHIDLKKFCEGHYTDWRAKCMPFFIIASSLTVINILLFVTSFGGFFLINLVLSAIICFLYAAAVQIIETSQYSHEGEIDISSMTAAQPIPTPSIPKPNKKFLPNHLLGFLSLICFIYISYLYFSDPNTLKDLCFNNYTYSLLPHDAIQALEIFFKLDQPIGFFTLFFLWIIIDTIIRIPFKILFWLASKMSPDKHTRDI